MVGYPNVLKAMVAYLKASLQEKTYSDYLQATREAEKEDSMELSQSQATDNSAKPRATSFFPLQKLKGIQPAVKTLAMHLASLEEESAKKDKEVVSKDPGGIDRVTKEFMVHLVRAVNGTQMEEKHCYHCSSLEHFIHNFPLVKALGVKTFKLQGGDVTKEGSLGPPDESDYTQDPPGRGSQGIGRCT